MIMSKMSMIKKFCILKVRSGAKYYSNFSILFQKKGGHFFFQFFSKMFFQKLNFILFFKANFVTFCHSSAMRVFRETAQFKS